VRRKPILQLGHGEIIDPGRALVAEHSLVRQPHVGSLDHALHRRVILRFRSPAGRRIDLDTSGQYPSFRLGSCSEATAPHGASVVRVGHEFRRPALGVVVRPFATIPRRYYGLG